MASPRDAYQINDGDLSTKLHQQRLANGAVEDHKVEAGEKLKAIVFGGLDGIITTFAVVAAAAAADLSRGAVLIVGFANLIGDALAMAVGDYLSSKAELDHCKTARADYKLLLRGDSKRAKSRLTKVYRQKGFSASEAQEVVEIFGEKEELLLDILMLEAEGFMPESMDDSPLQSALTTFTSFVVCGGIPMLAYLCAGDYGTLASLDYLFWISIALFGVTLFLLGAVKGYITRKSWWLSGAVMLLNGSVTTVAAYAIGLGLSEAMS
eukprot:Colp12_sorted_trinity150504_noHs@31923